MLPSDFARTPQPPYYAVMFTSRLAEPAEGYDEMARRMDELAADQPGYLSIESARGPDGRGITVSYWSSLAAIAAWKANISHRAAQALGRRKWYEAYAVRIAKVEHDYSQPGRQA